MDIVELNVLPPLNVEITASDLDFFPPYFATFTVCGREQQCYGQTHFECRCNAETIRRARLPVFMFEDTWDKAAGCCGDVFYRNPGSGVMQAREGGALYDALFGCDRDQMIYAQLLLSLSPCIDALMVIDDILELMGWEADLSLLPPAYQRQYETLCRCAAKAGIGKVYTVLPFGNVSSMSEILNNSKGD